jgi:hypothetical protein
VRFVLAVAMWLALGGEGHAQPAKATEAAKAAEAAFEKGRKLMASKSHAEACAAFELSQRLDPQYGTQFNLAGCYTALDKIATAWKLYRELSRSDNNAPRRARSGALAKQLAKRVPKLRIRVEPQPEGLKVLVGTIDVTALLGVELPFDLGPYAIEARAPDHLPFREEIELDAPGKVREIEIVLEPEPPPGTKPAPGGEGEGPAPPGPGVAGSSPRGRYGVIAMAGGGGVLGFGLFAGWRALVNRNVSRDLCSAGSCPDRPGSEARADRARLWGNLSTVTVIVGAVAVAGGVYLWRSGRVRAVPAAAPDAVSLVLSGVF